MTNDLKDKYLLSKLFNFVDVYHLVGILTTLMTVL
jgi:hypothetical protein